MEDSPHIRRMRTCVRLVDSVWWRVRKRLSRWFRIWTGQGRALRRSGGREKRVEVIAHIAFAACEGETADPSATLPRIKNHSIATRPVIQVPGGCPDLNGGVQFC